MTLGFALRTKAVSEDMLLHWQGPEGFTCTVDIPTAQALAEGAALINLNIWRLKWIGSVIAMIAAGVLLVWGMRSTLAPFYFIFCLLEMATLSLIVHLSVKYTMEYMRADKIFLKDVEELTEALLKGKAHPPLMTYMEFQKAMMDALLIEASMILKFESMMNDQFLSYDKRSYAAEMRTIDKERFNDLFRRSSQFQLHSLSKTSIFKRARQSIDTGQPTTTAVMDILK